MWPLIGQSCTIVVEYVDRSWWSFVEITIGAWSGQPRNNFRPSSSIAPELQQMTMASKLYSSHAVSLPCKKCNAYFQSMLYQLVAGIWFCTWEGLWREIPLIFTLPGSPFTTNHPAYEYWQQGLYLGLPQLDTDLFPHIWSLYKKWIMQPFTSATARGYESIRTRLSGV